MEIFHENNLVAGRGSKARCEKASKAAIIYELMTESDAEWCGHEKK